MASLHFQRLALLALLFASLLSTAFAPLPERGSRPPEDPNHPPPAVEVAPAQGNPPQGRNAPFSEQGSENHAADLVDLASKIKELIMSIADLYSVSSSTSSNLPTVSSSRATSTSAPSATTLQPNATLACAIYATYTSLCPPTSISTYTFPIAPGLTFTCDSACAASQAATFRASCLCYSGAYWVPGVYDNAAWACGGATATADPSLSGAVGSAVLTEGFCASIGNVRVSPTLASYATFGQYAVAVTSAPTTTASSTAGGSGSVTASGTGTGTGSTGTARARFGTQGLLWSAAAGVAMVVAAMIVL